MGIMKRTVWDELCIWKNAASRKPLLVQGARQVGKTWLLREFGKFCFNECIFLDFAEDPELSSLFKRNLKPARILDDLSLYLNREIDLDKTLLVFDEVQNCPDALTSLKYFYVKYPSAYICASGSLLGVGLSQQNFPVGKVDRLWLRPLSFEEFLLANGEERLAEKMADFGLRPQAIPSVIHGKIFDLFKTYLITGGMPEVVAKYIELKESRLMAFKAVRQLQHLLIDSYLDDFAKHSGNVNAIRIASVFKNIPKQLARECSGSRRFVFKDVLPGRSTYDVLAEPIAWLEQAGLIHCIPLCRTVRYPLEAYAQSDAFMLYLFDAGLLGAMLNLDPAVLQRYEFGQIKGFMAENAVLTELVYAGKKDVYTWRGKTAEIEFLLQHGDGVIPVEVKAGINTKAKSMKWFREKYNPELSIMFSAQGANQLDNGLLHAPLYLSAGVSLTLND